jgi:hypothetical protein
MPPKPAGKRKAAPGTSSHHTASLSLVSHTCSACVWQRRKPQATAPFSHTHTKPNFSLVTATGLTHTSPPVLPLVAQPRALLGRAPASNGSHGRGHVSSLHVRLTERSTCATLHTRLLAATITHTFALQLLPSIGRLGLPQQAFRLLSTRSLVAHPSRPCTCVKWQAWPWVATCHLACLVVCCTTRHAREVLRANTPTNTVAAALAPRLHQQTASDASVGQAVNS